MTGKNTNFKQIFFKNEYTKLAGEKNVVVKRLSLLLIFTLMSLGFAIGGLHQLKIRMENPFTNWVDLDMSPNVAKHLSDLRTDFQSTDFLDKYHLDGLGEWNRYHLSFNHRNFKPIGTRGDSLSYIRMGRTIDTEDALFGEIMNRESDNLLHYDPSAFDEEGDLLNPCGIIVTNALMKKLGYEEEEYASIEYLTLNVSQGKKILFFELLAVVQELPSLCHFVTTNKVYNITQGSFNGYIMGNSFSDSTTIRLISEQAQQRETLYKEVKAAFNIEDFDVSEEKIKMNAHKTLYAYVIRIIPTQAPSPAQVQAFIASRKKNKAFDDYNYVQCGEDAGIIIDPHFLTFNFNKLKEIKAFQQTLYREHDISLTMEQVESRENFRLVTRLTSTLGAVLFSFGLLSILLYLGNLIQSHILGIKMNLGTLKAMGLPNLTLQQTYTKVMMKLLAIALIIALPIALLMGWIINSYWLKIGFSLWHWSSPVAMIIIVLVVFTTVKYIINKVLKATPGNLIYERN